MRGTPVDGQLIRKTRKSMGLTQEQLAADAECDVKTLRKAEKSQHIDQCTVDRIALALKLEATDLINSAALDVEQANIQLVLSWQEAFNRRDPVAMAELFHTDGSVTVMADIPMPGGGEFLGKDGVLEWGRVCFATMRTQHITRDMFQIDAAGDFVFMRGLTDVEVTSLITNQTAKASAAHEFRIRNGKIAALRVITNTAAIAKILQKIDDET